MESIEYYQRSAPLSFFFATLAFCFLYWLAREDRTFNSFYIANKRGSDLFLRKAKEEWDYNAATITKEGFIKTNGRAFQVVTRHGPVIILPLSLCDETRNDPRLSFSGFLERQGLTNYPGLDVLHAGTQGDIIQETIRKNLTQSLGSLTDVLSNHTTEILDTHLPVGRDWQDVPISSVAVQIAARLSARVFLGERLCRDEDWIDISTKFTAVTFKAQESLRVWPSFMRPFVHRFVPLLRYQRSLIKHARVIIEPELEARRKARKDVVKPQDSLSWLDDTRGDREFDVARGQLFLSLAAIHTTSTVLTSIMYDLVAHPEYIDDLREEITRVLKEDGGWKKTSLYKMMLMDSCMKESQRLHVLGPTSMNRRVEAPMTLSDGTHLPKGVFVAFSSYDMRDGDVFKNPHEFNGRRFLDLRAQPGQVNRWQFVTTSPEYLSFGHGKHSCPGRFFASNEIKIALAHLLMKYDWKVSGAPPKSLLESRFLPDPKAVVACRKRELEPGIAILMG
ncbi:P450 monooxygenase [Lasiodiplodia theobromae]|uniref:P450 monooxygenase n=1 Tax=Lasiodiplodia theobromae TaxID=45133 RepID=A0A8H7MBH6_9PEZI|nr:P450 monooxygenase [Lasiodiplodia theobromae]